MHLVHPSLSSAGKKKGKQKFRNATEAKKSRELEDSWNQLMKKWDVAATPKRKKASKETLDYTLSTPDDRSTKHIKSAGEQVGVATKQQAPTYTGTKMVGISQTHKSNLVPVFNTDHVVDIARMRR